MIAIFAPTSTNRLEYLLHHAISVTWGDTYRLYNKEEPFLQEVAEAKINYSNQAMEGALWIPPAGLLAETGLRPLYPEMSWKNDTPHCFPTTVPGADLDWDPFSACFYYLSRYEELLPHTPDQHGRFRAEGSLAYRNECLQLAVVDRWLAETAEKLHKKFPAFTTRKKKCCFHPTYDIDQFFAYREKPALRNSAATLRQLLNGNWEGFRNRWQVRAGRKPDPYDTFALLQHLHEAEGLNPHYFVLFAPHSRHDKGLRPDNPTFRNRLKTLAEKGTIGLHGAYNTAFAQPEQLKTEADALSQCIGRPVTSHRAHYLRMRLPESVRYLTAAGITDDYSMGYANHTGFRAGTCKPFQYYDLLQERPLPLTLHPLLFMENAFFSCTDRSEPALWQQIQPLLEECIRFSGEMVTLFHNPSFGPMPGHDLPVPELYQHIIHYIKMTCQ